MSENTHTPVFPLLERSQLSPELQELYDRSLERRGEARFIGAIAHNPELLEWYLNQFYGNLFYGSPHLTPYLELGRLRLSDKHGCRSCNMGNRLDAHDHGLSGDKIANIADARHAAFDSADRAVIELADLLSLENRNAKLEEALYTKLGAHFSQSDIVTLSMVFSMLSGIARFLFAFDFVEREEYCRF